ncbi:SDR family oxidoreductase [Peribacillus sp. NPDC097284]|uniref:SDR family oxidoreductase n=1 Tax=Peribacillus sp. NPDC097284 TaxID=3364401 RepID=UPI00382C73AD
MERKSGHIINLSSVLRQEEAMSGTNIRVTNVSPGAVNSELLETTTDQESKSGLDEFYKIAIDADSIALAIAFAIEQPSDVAINEMIIRPTVQVG